MVQYMWTLVNMSLKNPHMLATSIDIWLRSKNYSTFANANKTDYFRVYVSIIGVALGHLVEKKQYLTDIFISKPSIFVFFSLDDKQLSSFLKPRWFIKISVSSLHQVGMTQM